MNFSEWSFVVGVVMTLALAMGPWMFKVHAKLAVIASKIIDLCDKIDDSREQCRDLWSVCSRHESRLDTHDVQFRHVAERLRRD